MHMFVLVCTWCQRMSFVADKRQLLTAIVFVFVVKADAKKSADCEYQA